MSPSQSSNSLIGKPQRQCCPRLCSQQRSASSPEVSSYEVFSLREYLIRFFCVFESSPRAELGSKYVNFTCWRHTLYFLGSIRPYWWPPVSVIRKPMPDPARKAGPASVIIFVHYVFLFGADYGPTLQRRCGRVQASFTSTRRWLSPCARNTMREEIGRDTSSSQHAGHAVRRNR